MSPVEARIQSAVAAAMAIPERHVYRLAGLVVGVPTWTVLAIARWLDPSPQGFGTHMQLGLGGCTMLTFTGWPCPMCGMTTTFALMAEGRVPEALANQPFGVVLFSLTAVAAMLAAVDVVGASGALRKGLAVIQRREQLYAILLLSGMIAGWLYKCALLHPETFGILP